MAVGLLITGGLDGFFMECLKCIQVHHGGITHKVPCGKCAFCLVNKRSQWMFRIFQELQRQGNPGWFITLTYNEKYVKRVPAGLSLRFRDVQLYLKKIRKAKYYAKYICVGEYGGETGRPHYHLLLWTDCPGMLLEKFWKARNGEVLGSLFFGRLSMASAMYTLKYIIQPKQKKIDGIEKTRAQFSKGLGLGYLSTAVYDYHTFDYESPCFCSVVDGREVALPRYYRYKIFTKYQLRREAGRLRDKYMKDETKQFKELRGKGVKNIRPYLQAVRVDQAEQIFKSTKLGLII